MGFGHLHGFGQRLQQIPGDGRGIAAHLQRRQDGDELVTAQASQRVGVAEAGAWTGVGIEVGLAASACDASADAWTSVGPTYGRGSPSPSVASSISPSSRIIPPPARFDQYSGRSFTGLMSRASMRFQMPGATQV